MKKQFLTAIALIIMSFAANAQVGIGTATPNSGALLDLTSTSKGLLLPRVANTAAITSPVNGMMIYDLSSNCFKAYQNNIWSGCGLLTPVSDQILAALTTSQAAYIASPANTWVAVTAAEYDAVLAGVTSATSYGVSNSLFSGGVLNAGWSLNTTTGLHTINSTQVPSGSYPIALRFRTKDSASGTGTAQLKFGATSINSYFDYIGTTPTFAATSSSTQYYVIKTPSINLASPGYIALNISGAEVGISTTSAAGSLYVEFSNIANGGNLTQNVGGYQPLIQVIGTSTKTW